MAIFSFEYGNRSIYRYYAWFLVLGCVFSVLNGFLIARPRALVQLPHNVGPRAWRPLSISKAISKANAVHLHAFKGFDFSSVPVVTPAEQELFDLLLRVVHDSNLNTTIRVAGGWVRDRMLRTASQKFDVDLALENMTGVQFVQHLKQWVRTEGKELPEVFQLSVIPQNVEKSKHLETVTGRFGKIEVDIVHLRSENYTSDSRVPTAQHGCPLTDALRRDLTINSLFYNLHTRQVEDHTGKGLQDLKQGIVRTPLSPLVTLLDDPLRAFRAVRFASRFQFRIDPELVQACKHPSVHQRIASIISPERCAVEMRRMFAGHAAAHSLARLYKYGLLQCVIKIPPIMLEPREKPSVKSPGKVVREYFPIANTTQKYLEQNLFPVGMSTFMIANYLRQVCSASSVPFEKAADDVGLLVNGGVFSGEFPRWKAFTESIKNHEDVWTEFTYACLLSVLQDHKESTFRMCVYDMRMSSTQYANIRRITEGAMDFAHILQNILTHAEIPRVSPVNAIASSLTDLSEPSALLLPNASESTDLLSQLLDLHQADQNSNAIDELTTPDGVSSPSSSPDGASGAISLRTSPPTPAEAVKVPVTLGALQRRELGQLLRRAGEGYRYALYLAAAQLVRERVLRAISDDMLKTDKTSSDDKVTLLNTIARDFTLLNRIKDDPDTTTDSTDINSDATGDSSSHISSVDFTAVSSRYATIYRTELHRVLQATEFFLEAIDTFQLDGVWHLQPAFKGRALMEMFPKLPQGPVIAEMLDAQIQWMLQNPEVSADHLEGHLRVVYAKYL